MTPEAAIILLVWVLIIICIAWLAIYIAKQMAAPPPVQMIIWAIALVFVLLILLRSTGLLHAMPNGFFEWVPSLYGSSAPAVS